MEYIAENEKMVVTLTPDRMRLIITYTLSSFTRIISLPEKYVHSILSEEGILVIMQRLVIYYSLIDQDIKYLINAESVNDILNSIPYDNKAYITVNYMGGYTILYATGDLKKLTPIFKFENSRIDSIATFNDIIIAVELKNNMIHYSKDGEHFEKYKFKEDIILHLIPGDGFIGIMCPEYQLYTSKDGIHWEHWDPHSEYK